jgi:hypothetical protein
MDNTDVTLPSGARLIITPSDFVLASKMNKIVAKLLKGNGFSMDIAGMDMSVLKDAILDLVASQELEDCVFECLQRSSYEGQKVTKNMLNDPKLDAKARGDFYFIVWHAIEANCGPFFGPVFSWLKGRRETTNGSQGSPSPLPTPSSSPSV